MPEQVIPQHVLNPGQPPQQHVAPPAPKPAKHTSMLEDLLFLGRSTEQVKVGEILFDISTLTQKETSELMKRVYASEDASDLFTIRVLTLAYAVKEVNGTPLEDVDVGDVSYGSDFEKKLDILMNMQKNVVEKLHDAYLDLVEKSDGLLDDPEAREELKN